MNESRRAWIVLLSLLFVQILLFGPIAGSIGVFMEPLIKEFGWNRAQVSAIATAFSISAGVFSLVVGWLLDRINGKWLMAAGLAVTGLTYFVAAQAHSWPVLFTCYIVIGAGFAFAGMTPTAVVAVSWFPNRRGLALAIAFFGIGIGMAVAPRLITSVVLRAGWRTGMIALGLPMLLLGLPVTLGLIATREREVVDQSGLLAEIPGLEVGPALRTSAFWLLVGLALLSQTAVGEVFYHMIPYLVRTGYSPQAAALVLGGQAILVSLSAIIEGELADRHGPKWVLAGTFLILAISLVLLLNAGNPQFGLWATIGFILLWGTGMGNALLGPMMVASNLGMRRFGTFTGIIALVWSVGQGIGPILAGIVFDMTRTYRVPFTIALLEFAVSVVLTALVFPAAGHDAVPSSEAGAPPLVAAANLEP